MELKMKKIGLIGGLSWQSSIEYYRIINEQSNLLLGGSHTVESIMYSTDLPQKLGLMSRRETAELAREFIDISNSLAAAGAGMVLLCTNTMHAVFDEIESSISLPMIHIADATAQAIKEKGLKKVALLGTVFTMQQPFYKDRLARHGIEVTVPSEDEAQEIHRVIVDELTFGDIRESSRALYLDIMERLRREEGAEGAILGCTEIPLLIHQEHTDIPVFDTTFLHAMAAVKLALE